jgi:hypothetical protein
MSKSIDGGLAVDIEVSGIRTYKEHLQWCENELTHPMSEKFPAVLWSIKPKKLEPL